jgi:methyl-accepting chemotaxis protein
MRLLYWELPYHVDDHEAVQLKFARLTELDESLQEQFIIYDSTVFDWSLEVDYLKFKELYQQFSDSFDEMKNAANAADTEAMYAINDSMSGLLADAAATLELCAEANKMMAEDLLGRTQRMHNLMLCIQILLSVFSVSVALVLSKIVSNIIHTPVDIINRILHQASHTGDLHFADEIWNAAQELSAGKDELSSSITYFSNFMQKLTYYSQILLQISHNDLTVEVEPLSEQDTIGTSLQHMVKSLRMTIQSVNAATVEAHGDAGLISDEAATLAQRTTRHAEAVKQLSEAIDRITKKTQSNADLAAEAAVLANNMREDALLSSRHMSDVTAAVEQINAANHSIRSVIQAIEGIASQTNLLALNAAIEAARAGDAGMGFAVVASEVRKLAAKSAEAVKETSALIEDSIKKAEEGAQTVEMAAHALDKIANSIDLETSTVNKIASSTEAQALEIEEINSSVGEVSDGIQDNNRTAQDTAASTEKLENQFTILAENVARFKLA